MAPSQTTHFDRRRFLGALAALPITPVWAADCRNPGSKAQALHDLAEDYFHRLLALNPLEASRLGLASEAQAASIAIDIAPAHLQRIAAEQRRCLGALARIDRQRLAPADAILWEFLDFQCRDGLTMAKFPSHLLPLDQMGDSVPFVLANATENGICPFADERDHRHHLARLSQLPRWCDQAIVNMRQGIAAGIVHARPIVERTLTLLRELATPGDKNPFRMPMAQRSSGLDPAVRRRLNADYDELISRRLVPALAQVLYVMENDLLPAARSSSGWGALPGGREWYAAAAGSHTTTTLSPDEIAALGASEVARLRVEMIKVQARLGGSGPLDAFLAEYRLRRATRPFKTEAEVLAAYRALNARVMSGLPRLFGRRPKAALEIRPEPELTRATASDHYMLPSPDGSRPGVFYAVINDPADYAATGMATLFLHEGQPGHHFQIALAQELPLSSPQRFSGFTAFSEGWALYAETLGFDLGVYDTPDAHLGHLLDAQLRAVRLVVDTGMHHQGWSRERAIAYYRQQLGAEEWEARNQIERYMVWPGQALAYAVGRITLERLRDKARAALGARFSLAAFHDEVLASGALPLAVLEAKIGRWIACQA